jgi:hypothetical protein
MYFMRGWHKYANMTKMREKDHHPSHHLLLAIHEVPATWHDCVTFEYVVL